MREKITIAAFCLCSFTIVSMAKANEPVVKVPFAFIDRFSETAAKLGFETGSRLAIGALVVPGDSPITSVEVKNLNTGETLTARSGAGISKIFEEGESKPILWDVIPKPAFDPSKHTGVWEVIVKDEKGNEVVAETHNLDKIAEMPFVKGLKASGNALNPTISWNETDEKDIPKDCETEYRVRLLKNIDEQLHRSKVLQDQKYNVPEGILKDSDIADTYVRVEFTCVDKDDKEYAAPVETRSETIVSLKQLLDEAN